MWQKLSEEFIERYFDKVHWYSISSDRDLSEDFIERNCALVYWDQISLNQKLSEAFIEKYSDRLNWKYVSGYQVLSEEFIERYSDKVDWEYISKYQKLSSEFIEKYNLIIPETCWLYKDTEYLKGEVEKLKLYECHEEYFIAYVDTKSFTFPGKTFQEQLTIEEIYESRSDRIIDRGHLFNLSVWEKTECCNIASFKPIKIKIRYEDVGAIENNGREIRCRKLTVLS